MEASRLAVFGAAIGDAARAQIVAVLASGTRHSAGDLARDLGLAPSTTSRHLGILIDAGLIEVEANGRHRHFGLASADVADMLEAIDALELTETNPPAHPPLDAPLRVARSCYDHLAGRLGVDLTEAMVADGVLESDDLAITKRGTTKLGDVGIAIDDLRTRRRPLTRRCLDWTERSYHLGGAIGANLLTHMLEQRWLARHRTERRVLHITPTGKEMLVAHFGLKIPEV